MILELLQTLQSLGLTETTLAIIQEQVVRSVYQINWCWQSERINLYRQTYFSTRSKRYGLVEFVVPAHLLEEKAVEIAEKIASNGPIAVRLAKKAISTVFKLIYIPDYKWKKNKRMKV